jgi:DNA-binding LacI/PurR family transcriptional regulator
LSRTDFQEVSVAVTLEDVAARAGVSRALVSLALRNSPKVAELSRQRVLAAAAELGYRPNLNARRLASRQSGTIGVLLADLHNPVFADVLDGLDQSTHRGPDQLLLASGFRDPERERAAVESFLSHQVDGIVVIGSRLSASEIQALSRITPTVVAGQRIRGVDCVFVDDALGARLLTEHLISLGHRRIAHLDGGKGAGAAPRRRAYADTMRAHGLGQNIRICAGNFSEEAGQAGFEQLWQEPRPTAIFAANDLSALGLLTAARARGVDIPADLSVAGFDNTTIAQSGYVSLTTVDFPRAQMGEVAGDLIRMRVSGGDAKAHAIMLSPTLVVRDTTSAIESAPRRDVTA